jgi:membrane-bound serine protease (ClpP class)
VRGFSSKLNQPARARLDPEGYVLFQGEYWRAKAEETVEKGETVVILAKVETLLQVKRKQD